VKPPPTRLADGRRGEHRAGKVEKQQRAAAPLDLGHAAGRNPGAARYLDPRHVVAPKTRILPIL